MKEDRFDDIIRNKLDNINPENGIDAWSIFEKKMQADQDLNTLSEDIEFDQTVNQKIRQHATVFRSDHWNILKTQLQTIERRVRTIWFSKALEVCAVFLIGFTFLNVSHLLDKSKDQNQRVLIAENTLNTILNDVKSNNDYLLEVDKGSINNQHNSPKNKLDINSNQKEELESKFVENGKFINLHKELAGFVKSKEEMNGEPLILNIVSANSGDFEALVQNMELSLINDIRNTDELNKIGSNMEFVTSEMALSFPMTRANETVSAKNYISVYTSADVNLINTPFDKLYSLASYDKEALNDSYGINFSRKKNNVEVEMGLGLAHRTYQPEFVTEAFGQFGDHYFEKSLKTISFDIINIPLNIKYHFINSSQWSAYIMAGASMNMIANADYEISEILREGRPANRNAPDQARLDEKSFTKGILHSGSLNENYFATVGFGFGIEKRLFSNTSIYIQPNYQRHILSNDIGIGPNKDQIHSASLQFGVKTALN
jgi:hypothetical protein